MSALDLPADPASAAGSGSPALRSVEPRDHDAVLDLNARHVPAVSPMDEERLILLLDLADRADVVDLDGEVAGFVMTFGPGSVYDSRNYRAFAERFGSSFYYLDRIVIDGRFQRRGLGRFVYDEIELVATAYSRLALEVNTEPPNPASMAFHLARGYAEVGRLAHGGHEVALLVKELG